MIYKIANMLRDEIQALNFVEIAAGLATPHTVRVNATPSDSSEGVMEGRVIPMAYNDLGIACEEGDLYKLVPDTSKKSIVWWESNGIEPVREDTYYIYSRANLVCMCWWNLPLIDEYMSDPGLLVARLIATIPGRLPNVEYMSQIQVMFAGEEPPGSEILSRYGFDEPESQFATFPYFVTALNFTVEFAFGKNCTEAITLSPSECPPRMIAGSEVAFAEVVYAGVQATIILRFPTYSSVTVDWGDGNTETQSGLGDSVNVTFASNYTVNDTYSVTLRGNLRNISYIRCSGQAHVQGDVSAWTIFRNVKTINISSSGFTGSVANWKVLVNLESLNLTNFLGTGDIGDWYLLTALQNLTLESANGLTGNITGWSAMVNLRTLALCGGVSADITEWTNFDYLYQVLLSFILPRPTIYGDIAPFLENIALASVFAYDASVTYSNASMPATLTQLDLSECSNLTSGMVDQILIDIDSAGALNGLIGMVGCACRTAVSNAARASLDAKGWTVNVEEAEGLNGGGIIAGTTQSDWICDNSGLGGLWVIVGAGTPLIVTGNGFTGNAQRFEDLGPGNGGIEIDADWLGADVLTIGNPYNLIFQYRKKIGSPNIICPSLTGSPIVAAVDNEGPAAMSIFLGPLNAIDTKLTLQFAGGGAPGDWFEVDFISFV